MYRSQLELVMLRHTAYALVSLALGAMMWPLLWIWPLTGFILSSPGFLHATETLSTQLVAMSLSGLFAAHLLRAMIYRASTLREFAITSAIAILVCAFTFGVVFIAGSELVGYLRTGPLPSAAGGLVTILFGSLASGLIGLGFGIVSLPIMVPAGMCGIFLLKRVLSANSVQQRDALEQQTD